MRRTACSRVRAGRRGEEPPTHAVSDLFDLPPTLHAPAHGSRGCTRGLLADDAPQSALPPLVSINHKWYRERRYTRALTSVYAQLRAAPRLQRMVDAYLAEVGARYGSGSWACIHLRLERDWVNTAAMCNRPEGRYCWSPEQARRARQPRPRRALYLSAHPHARRRCSRASPRLTAPASFLSCPHATRRLRPPRACAKRSLPQCTRPSRRI